MIRHVVLLKFKDETTTRCRAELAEAFAALSQQIDAVRSLEWGLNVSPEGLDKGFTHCFLVTFKSGADRDAYLSHPVHQAFVDKLKPWSADVLVIDYAQP